MKKCWDAMFQENSFYTVNVLAMLHAFVMVTLKIQNTICLVNKGNNYRKEYLHMLQYTVQHSLHHSEYSGMLHTCAGGYLEHCIHNSLPREQQLCAPVTLVHSKIRMLHTCTRVTWRTLHAYFCPKRTLQKNLFASYHATLGMLNIYARVIKDA